ncbi:MAG: hypothetical protein ACLPTZ_00210 [Beijerinckiaceae bacterium]
MRLQNLCAGTRISRLRKRLADEANECRILETVYDAGCMRAVRAERV